jgi:hypothetical protein
MIKKGQVTMETIMIYGIVAIVAASGVGALIYFGVLDVGKYLPDKCNLNTIDIQCEQWIMDTEDGIGLGLKNLNKYSINISEITYMTSDESEKLNNGTANMKKCTTSNMSIIIDSNKLGSFTTDGTGVQNGTCKISHDTKVGEKIKLDFVIKYKTQVPGGNSLQQKAAGELLATRV